MDRAEAVLVVALVEVAVVVFVEVISGGRGNDVLAKLPTNQPTSRHIISFRNVLIENFLTVSMNRL